LRRRPRPKLGCGAKERERKKEREKERKYPSSGSQHYDSEVNIETRNETMAKCVMQVLNGHIQVAVY
jgi:hypothetical protein